MVLPRRDEWLARSALTSPLNPPVSAGRRARVAARPLVGDDPSLLEDLTAPDAERFSPVDRARQARPPQRARPAQRLGQIEIRGMLGEPQLRFVAAGQRIAQACAEPSAALSA